MITGRNFANLCVLLVEDDPECGDFFESVLLGEGIKVCRSRNAESAVEILKEQKFDIVLSDKNLPGMDGIALIKHIRGNYGTLPVVLITGEGTVGSAVDAFKFGAQDFLLKPLDDSELLLKTVWNVVEQRRLADENKMLQRKLILAERMESLGLLATGVAHEINNPTSFVLGNLELLREDMREFAKISEGLQSILADVMSGEQKEVERARKRFEELRQNASLRRIQDDAVQMIEEAIDGAHRIRRIVGSLRGFARPDYETMEPVDLNEELEKSLTLVWNELKYKCKVTKELQELPKVVGNPSQIDQVLVNILLNAGQAIEQKEGSIVIKTYHENSRVFITISDNGKGIAAECMKHIFDPFFTTKDVGSGTGLGLYIVYDIVKRHAGSIDVKSQVGEGTTFILAFPEDTSHG